MTIATRVYQTRFAELLPYLLLVAAACSSDPKGTTVKEPVEGKPAGKDSGAVSEDEDEDDDDGDDDGSRTGTDAGRPRPPVAIDSGLNGTVKPGDSGAPAAGDAGKAADSAVPVATEDKACNPADKTADAKMLANPGTGAKPVGEYATVVESDPGLPDQTIYRPDPLGAIKHPVFAWGNGGCMKNNSGFAEFLLQIASQGILVIADGTPGGSGSSASDGKQLIKGVDWAEKENERPCSKYYHKLDLTKVAVSGQSCGGLMAINAGADKRVATSMPMNSGLMAANPTLYAALRAPMAIINGGSSDIAYDYGNQTFEGINTIPIMVANTPVGHGGTYREDNGGEMGKAAVGWVRWHLLNDEGPTGKGLFVGSSCGLCGSKWEIKWKMEPK